MIFPVLPAVFFCIGILHLIFILRGFKSGSRWTKILLMPFLAGWVLFSQAVPLLLLALFFGWLGDVLLLKKDEHLFLKLGLFAFLLGHIAYISVFLLHLRAFPSLSVIGGIIVAYFLFGVGIFLLLRPGLGRMAVPVGAYIFVISCMSAASLMYALSIGKTAWWAFAGSILFVFSDTVLSLQLFRKPFRYGRFLVMASYIPAQFLLVWGILNQ